MSLSKNLKKTKIIATYGPSCNKTKDIVALIRSGVDIIRINSSHIDHLDEVANIVEIIREAEKQSNRFVAIMLDLQGPKIRLGKFANPPINLKTNQEFIIQNTDTIGNSSAASISYKALASEVNIGELIYFDDGKIQLIVKKIEKNDIICTVIKGGALTNHKGVNLPFSKLNISALTKKDYLFASEAIKTGCDYLAVSFVSNADDINNLRCFLAKHHGNNLHIISKIERQQALDNIESIIKASDAVMVARGDLGVEIGVENVPKAQKIIIQKSNYYIKPVIVATQMLESMIHSQIATRAEASDVANAIYDQCDAVMLSGETAVGISPVSAVETMVNICLATEEHLGQLNQLTTTIQKKRFFSADTPTILCKSSTRIADETESDFIVSFTSSGNTSKICSKLHAPITILSPTDNEYVCRYMCLYRGVIPLLMPKDFKDIVRWRDMIDLFIGIAQKKKIVKENDKLVVLAGIPIGTSGGLNSIRLVSVS